MKAAYVSSVLLTVGLAACAHSPQPYRFVVSETGNDVDIVVRTLRASGLQPAEIDRKQGTVTTYWFDTGYRFRRTDMSKTPQYDTDIFLRYRISLRRDDGQETVILDTDVQRCAPADTTVTASGVIGSCEPMTTLFPTQQKQADALGEKLRQALRSSIERSAANG